MAISVQEETDFNILAGKLAGTLDGPPGEKTLDNLHRLLLLAQDEFPDDDEIIELLNRYAFMPVSNLTKGITRACRRVCKIVNGGGPSTGALIGPDLVLAARHALRGTGTFANPDDVEVFFDEFTFNDGQKHRLVCRVARTADGARLRVLASSVELDYVVFHLDSPIGLNCLGTSLRKRRGWMDLSTVNVAPKGEVIILQHPEGRLMKVSDGIVKPDTTVTAPGRFRYNTETGAGSSGAPVLNKARQLVGMHVKETPNDIEELISLTAISEHLGQQQIRLPRYPPPKAFTSRFLEMLLAPQDDMAFA